MGVSISKALSLSVQLAGSSRTPVEEPVYLLISDALFRIANSPDPKKRGSVAKATQAQKMILDRMVGTRKPGSHPAVQDAAEITFVNLTTPELGSTDVTRTV